MTVPFKLKPLIPSETDECVSLLQWAYLQKHHGRRLSDLLVMIPNGAVLAGDYRQRCIAMARMKRCGFRVGCFDYLLPVPIGSSPGLWLEIKRQHGGSVSPEQREFDAVMTALGWQTLIAKGWEQAAKGIHEYLRSC